MTALLEISHVSKRFPGVVALDDVDFSLASGEVHALLGENGAGKSTLVKIITGAYRKDTGTLTLEGRDVNFASPAEARAIGIGAVYQEFSLVNTLTVAENIHLGGYPKRGLFIDWEKMNADSGALLSRFGVNAQPTDTVSSLGVATRQMIEILKALRRNNLRVLILDEPTSSLSAGETSTLFNFIAALKASGVSIIYISHRLDEIKQIADRVTIFRNGRRISTAAAADMSIDDMVTQMIGSELKEHYPAKCAMQGEALVEVKSLCGKGFNDIEFVARRGDVLGITGLVGAGKTELLESLFGARPVTVGTVAISGKSVDLGGPKRTIAAGLGLLPESRKEQGLVLSLSCTHNISLASLRDISRPLLDLVREEQVADAQFTRLEVRPGNPRNRVVNLSGGNQQKIVLAKWLMRDCDVLLFDEPTRGVDVGAKFHIYSLIVELAKAGKAIIVSSSEIEEICGICNHVLVLQKGRIAARLSDRHVNRSAVLAAISGGESAA